MANSEIRRDDMGAIYFGMLALLAAFLYFCWLSEHTLIAYYGLRWSWYQLAVLDWWPAAQEWRREIARLAMHPGTVSFDALLQAANRAGRLPAALVIALALRAIRLTARHPAHRTRRHITADTLPQIMSAHSPAVIPTLYYGDLLNTDPEEHRSALSPDEWVAHNRLLVDGALDRQRCRTFLKKDLGPRIASLDALQPHEKAMFAVFGARLLSDGNDIPKAQALLDQLNRSCRTHQWEGKQGYPDLSLATAAFEHYAHHPDAGAWLARHTYARTLLYAMHRQALKSGKLPSSHFRWLKGMDRPLWYALNTTGRKAPFVESAAVFTQAQWEEFAHACGYTLAAPALDDAVDGIHAYLVKIGLITSHR